MGIYLREDIEKTRQTKNNKLILTKLIKIMKKVIFALAAVVALAACSNEEVIVADKGAAIGFDTFVENSTRAAQSTDPSLTVDKMKTTGFGVYGFVTNEVDDNDVTAPLFNNKQVKWTNGVWKYEGTQYWMDGATYDFAAIAPYGEYTVTAAAPTGVTLDFESDGVTDLLYAQNNEAPHTTVGFTFKHLLSKVKFTFTNGYDATNTVIAVKNIVINDAYSVGAAQLGRDANGVTATWTPSSANLDLEFGDAVNADKYIAQGAKEESANALLLIPSNTTYNVTFTIELLYHNGVDRYVKVKEYIHTVALTHNFEFGKSYNVATTINYTNIVPDDPSNPNDNEQKPIEFTVTAIENWQDGTVGALPL